jgi:hypothetical protein
MSKNEADRSTERRLCWWRDPELQADFPVPEPEFSDPDMRYRYERAQAEEEFRQNFNTWEAVNRDNPPCVTIASPRSGEVRTSVRDDASIAYSLESHVRQYFHHALIAYADLLLDLETPAKEALQAFDGHAEELARETYSQKWLVGLRRLELSQHEYGLQFWDVQKEVVESVRHDFEELVWDSEMEHVAPAEEPQAGPGRGRRRDVEAFMAQVFRATGRRILKKDIWTAAGYSDRTEFERFQRGDARTTASAAANFERVLKMEPKLFVELLDRLRLSKQATK